MGIFHVTKDNYEKEVIQEDKYTVVLDFWAPWCVPCKMLSPILDQIAKEESKVKICKINVDEEPELADKNNVMSIPMLQIMHQGDVKKRSVGLISKKEILSMLEVNKTDIIAAQIKE